MGPRVIVALAALLALPVAGLRAGGLGGETRVAGDPSWSADDPDADGDDGDDDDPQGQAPDDDGPGGSYDDADDSSPQPAAAHPAPARGDPPGKL